MTGLEFERILNSAHLSPGARHLLTYQRAVYIEQGRQLTMAINLVEALANTVKQFVDLHGSTQEKMRELVNAGKEEGVDVHSEAIDETEH